MGRIDYRHYRSDTPSLFRLIFTHISNTVKLSVVFVLCIELLQPSVNSDWRG